MKHFQTWVQSSVFSCALAVVFISAPLLTAAADPTCAAPPSGLVSWWRGEGDGVDHTGNNNGALVGNTTFVAGRAGQAFSLDGNGDLVNVGNSPALQLQDFTIEAWIKRASTARVTFGSFGNGIIFGYGHGGYGLYLDANGRPALSKIGVNEVKPNVTITDTNFHHIAVTKSGSTVVFFVDGTAYSAGSYNPGFTFSTVAAIGARGDNNDNSFLGIIDEVSVYNRALTASEVQSIQAAGADGKCTGGSAPIIVSHPTNQTVLEGESATFTVDATGTQPLTYQWSFDDEDIDGATSASLTLANIHLNQAGVYAVRISNEFGLAISSNAVLTVLSEPSCVTPPAGLVSWWRAEGNASDEAGGNHGILAGDTHFDVGRAGQAFAFDGHGDIVTVGNPANLQLQDFTIEAWIKRASTTAVSHGSFGNGIIFGYGENGYGLYLSPGGHPALSQIGASAVFPDVTINDTEYHHLAVTKSGAEVVFYVDGVSYAAPAYAPEFSFATVAAIGARGDNLDNSFLGAIDEVSVYNRPLSAAEIQAVFAAGGTGKCVISAAPFIVTQPADQTVTAGGTATFTVVASGTPALAYQWRFEGEEIEGATDASLIITNVQVGNAGSYSVVVTNAFGSIDSSNAILTVNLPPAAVQVVGTSVRGGQSVVVPIVLVANGNENAIGFSLNFPPELLTYSSATPGEDAGEAALLVNSSQAASGWVGIAVALPPDATFTAGSVQLVDVVFTSQIVDLETSAILSFGNVPITRQLSGSSGDPLAATYTGGAVTLTQTDFEGDVSPRPDGDRAVMITDWVILGRYAARLDYPTNASEFQRADCAPRSTLGDGEIRVADWVQAGRYAAGLDPLTPVGGPDSEVLQLAAASRSGPQTSGGAGSSRRISLCSASMIQGTTGTVKVHLESLGNENAVGLSFAFDPSAFEFLGASPGSGASGAILNVNSSQAASGRVGFVLALGAGNGFAAGDRELVKLNFRALSQNPGEQTVSFSDQPVPRDLCDAKAESLDAEYVSATIVVNPVPSLRIEQSDDHVTLAWPLWASDFLLEESEEGSLEPAVWTEVPGTPKANGDENTITVPVNGTKFFRLHRP